MQFRLYKLQFTAPCHFGDGETSADLAGSGTTCFSDTLVSALFLEYLALYGEEIAKQFINALQNGLLRFSDLFPYIGDSDTLFLPRPQLISQKRIDRTEFPIEEIIRKFWLSIFNCSCDWNHLKSLFTFFARASVNTNFTSSTI